uniref:Uncharacterized protein n=1 Tax=Physcomitrium patens TaxID=3218 RepID=A0A2K1JQZ7_PHYPA|nr:hypothetical protein PHYPA_016340 [Physcomitrium patens]
MTVSCSVAGNYQRLKLSMLEDEAIKTYIRFEIEPGMWRFFFFQRLTGHGTTLIVRLKFPSCCQIG